jgi:glutamine---fructose-6-phosphate transaminase (isomerizing)
MALYIGYQRGAISNKRYLQLISELELIPSKIQKILQLDKKIEEIAAKFKDASNSIYLGRGYNYPVALEGALKLKEISYIHAEGYPAAEMKHGPIALIDENMPVWVIATNTNHYEKIVSNIMEVKARKGEIFAVVKEGDTIISQLADHVIEIPATEEVFSPMLSVIPLQLLAYHAAVMRGCNVDQPRNLAKSVTVE